MSKDALKKANTKIDFTNDKLNILGQEIDIKFKTSGHYTIPISKSYEALNKFSEESYDNILLSIDNIALKRRNKKKEKLQKNYINCSDTLAPVKL